MGIATLRMAMLPTEVPPDRREMVLMAGRGSYMMATRQTAAAAQAFEGLVARYPETPNVHYAYGVYLLIEQPEKAIEEFKRELQIQPNHRDALMQIAYEYLKEGNAAAAKEREEFARLDRLVGTKRNCSQSVGGIDAAETPRTKPPSPQ